MSKLVKLTLAIAVIAIVGLVGYTLVRSKAGADVVTEAEKLSIVNFQDRSNELLPYFATNIPSDSFALDNNLSSPNASGYSNGNPIVFVTGLYYFHDNTTTKYSPKVFKYAGNKIEKIGELPQLSQDQQYPNFNNIIYLNINDNTNTNDAVYLSSSSSQNLYKFSENGQFQDMINKFPKGIFKPQTLMSNGRYLIAAGFDVNFGKFHLVQYNPFFDKIDDQSDSTLINLGDSANYYDKEITSGAWNQQGWLGSSDPTHRLKDDYGLIAIKYSNKSKLSLIRIKHDVNDVLISEDITNKFQQISNGGSGVISPTYNIIGMSYSDKLNQILLNTGNGFYTYDGSDFSIYESGITMASNNVLKPASQLIGSQGWLIGVNKADGREEASRLYNSESSLAVDLTNIIQYSKNSNDGSLQSSINSISTYLDGLGSVPHKGYGLVMGYPRLLNSFEIVSQDNSSEPIVTISGITVTPKVIYPGTNITLEADVAIENAQISEVNGGIVPSPNITGEGFILVPMTAVAGNSSGQGHYKGETVLPPDAKIGQWESIISVVGIGGGKLGSKAGPNFTVSALPPPEPQEVHDLSIITFSASPNPVKRGKTTTFTTTIKNNGTVEESLYVVTYTDEKGNTISSPQTIGNIINPGGKLSLYYNRKTKITTKPGEYTVNVKITPIAGEQNTQDNSKSTKLTVTK